MVDYTGESLNKIYRPLVEKTYDLVSSLTKLHGGFKVTSGFIMVITIKMIKENTRKIIILFP